MKWDFETRRKVMYFAAHARYVGELLSKWQGITKPWESDEPLTPAQAAQENAEVLRQLIQSTLDESTALPRIKTVRLIAELLIRAAYELRSLDLPARWFLEEGDEQGAIRFYRKMARSAHVAVTRPIMRLWPRLMYFADDNFAEQSATDVIFTETTLPAEYRENGEKTGEPLVLPYLEDHRDWSLGPGQLAGARKRGDVPYVKVRIQGKTKAAHQYVALAAYRHGATTRECDKEDAAH